MATLITLAACTLNQWALDFDGNKARIVESVHRAKKLGARYRLGPELEVCGYGCNDHFYESDTYEHSWEVIGELLKDRSLDDIIIDIGMPVMHKTVKYNCRILLLNGRVLFIRPKMFLANDGNYRETRWFTPWMRPRSHETYPLPSHIQHITHQETVLFGDVVLNADGISMGSEICEELFTPMSPHLTMSLDGIEIFTNGSASHHELRKLNKRIDLMRFATQKCGGLYLYANHQGCDGERVYYDGCALIVFNGEIVAQGSQFSLDDVEVVAATVDLEQVRSFRTAFISRGMQAAQSHAYHRINTTFSLLSSSSGPAVPKSPKLNTPVEEIALGPACWLWDYLRRSKMKGFFLPLSGGIDSCSTALIVYSMCRLIVAKVRDGDATALRDVRQVTGDSGYRPTDHNELCSRILHTCYMGSENSSKDTRLRAQQLATAIGSFHLNCEIDTIVSAFLLIFTAVTQLVPKYKVHGGTPAENLALQNIQARVRMVLGYMFAQLLLWFRGRDGSLLVLGSSNVDECLRGYLTKYDCSSADINPIGSISKRDLTSFVRYARDAFSLPILDEFLNAIPTAELEPITSTHVQADEADMGMTYDELNVFGRMRKIQRCGPVSMFTKLCWEWRDVYTPQQIAEKVKRFFFYYSINRHKMTTLTPSYHAESYSPDDHRFDLRPFLYRSSWDHQFRKIDELVEQHQDIRTKPAFEEYH